MNPPDPIPVKLFEPARPASFAVFASPHSGRVYPAARVARAQVSGAALRSSEDAYVDLLLEGAPAHGAPLITTEVPRAFVDFNRAPDELDPALIEGVARSGVNPRVASGLGVIARVVAGGRPIYAGMLTQDEARARLRACWHPYHDALSGLLARQRQRHGQVLLCDVHSMPHEALSGLARRGAGRPEVVLGDRFGASCRPDLMAAIEGVFARAGLRVARNAPFAGAFVAQRYGNPATGVSVVQIEIDRALYLDESRVEPGPGFDAFRALMAGIVAEIATICAAQGPMEMAAE